MENIYLTPKEINKDEKTWKKYLNDYIIDNYNPFWLHNETYNIVRIDLMMVGIELAEKFYNNNEKSFDKKGFEQYLISLKDEYYKHNHYKGTAEHLIKVSKDDDEKCIKNFINDVVQLKKELKEKGIDRKEIKNIVGDIICSNFNTKSYYKNKYQNVILKETDDEIKNSFLKDVYKRIGKNTLITSPDKNNEFGKSSHPMWKPSNKKENELER